MPKVSITLATFNVAPFLVNSLSCIVNQSLKDVEIICIDDGSTDGTSDILLDYAARYPHMRVILNEKNEGLAVARNQALALAKGKYIAFVDGDDLMDIHLMEKAYALAEQENSDIVVWDYLSFVNQADIDKGLEQASILNQVNPTDRIALLQRPAFTWVKLFRTAMLRELKVEFPKGLTRQDIPVHWKLMTQAKKISILPEKLSFYRQQAGATTHKKNEKLFDLATVTDQAGDFLHANDLYTEFRDEYLRQQLNLLHGMYDNVQDHLKAKALSLIEERLGDDQMNYILSERPLRPQARMFYKARFGSKVNKAKYALWSAARSTYRKLKRK